MYNYCIGVGFGFGFGVEEFSILVDENI